MIFQPTDARRPIRLLKSLYSEACETEARVVARQRRKYTTAGAGVIGELHGGQAAGLTACLLSALSVFDPL